MKIGQLLNRGAVLHCGLDPNLDVSSLTYDSRRVQRGSLFFALRGVSADGNDFFLEALRQGALGVVSDQAPPSDLAHLWIHVEMRDGRWHLLRGIFTAIRRAASS